MCAIGALMRMTLRTSMTIAGHPSEITYPQDYLLGVFEDEAAADWTAGDLLDAGFVEDELMAFCGAEGARALDPSGEEHGLLFRIYRTIQNLYAEFDSMREYADAAVGGACVLGVRIPDDTRKEAASRIFARRGGRLVAAFGRMTVENIDHRDRQGS